MENVVLTVHLIIATSLTLVVLMQRSEGGGLGIGGGGGTATGRSPVTPLGKVTWILAIAFICTSIALTVLAAQGTSRGSVIDLLGPAPGSAPGSELLPPALGDDSLTPPRVD